MEDPKYEPEQWVQFKTTDGRAFGKIEVGRAGPDGVWHYDVGNPMDPEARKTVAEPDIIAFFNDTYWVKE